MCLAIPMKIVEIDGIEAECEAQGIRRRVSLMLLSHEELQPGDHVMVHIGSAIQKIDEADAKATWAIIQEVFEIEQGAIANA